MKLYENESLFLMEKRYRYAFACLFDEHDEQMECLICDHIIPLRYGTYINGECPECAIEYAYECCECGNLFTIPYGRLEENGDRRFACNGCFNCVSGRKYHSYCPDCGTRHQQFVRLKDNWFETPCFKVLHKLGFSVKMGYIWLTGLYLVI